MLPPTPKRSSTGDAAFLILHMQKQVQGLRSTRLHSTEGSEIGAGAVFWGVVTQRDTVLHRYNAALAFCSSGRVCRSGSRG